MVDVREWSRSDTARLLRVPTSQDDKYSRGVVALRTGSDAYPGAAVLGVEAAWRTGAGFVRYVGGRRAADAVLARRPETVTGADAGRTRVGAWVIGSGTDAADRDDAERDALREILDGDAPVVVDAGAIDLAVDARGTFLITPHAGEFARLRTQLRLPDDGLTTEEAVVAVAATLGGVVLLKGARTLVGDPHGALVAVEEGVGWLATAGTGDVLAGVIGAVVAANPDRSLLEAAAAGAWLHGRAGRVAAGMTGNDSPTHGHPVVALDVAEALPHVIADLLA
ncbi:MAG: NAD(P)H-hydrate dehydratase [Microbacterium sp.]|nr:NAD(P)H-hydrate dehydratase [Microbacterium sp.]